MRERRNIGASVRARLLALSKQRHQPLDLLMTRYVLERLLYRLSLTPHRDRMVLKGAMLMTTWFDNPFRPTRDLDLLGFGDPSESALLAVFREICGMEQDDGVAFDMDALEIGRIREVTEYGGLRIRTRATLAGARLRVVVDVGFGDAVEPGIMELQLPVLLDLPAPRLRAYPRETVIAEKFQAMVMLGRANSRMKDIYDIWMLIQMFAFEGDDLARAIGATFARRNTAIPTTTPDGLSRAFADDPAKQRQWVSFLEGIEAAHLPLGTAIDALAGFLMTHAARARTLRR